LTFLVAIFCAVVFGLEPGGPSLWRAAATSIPFSSCFQLLTLTSYQRRQLLGLRPPADL